MVHGARERREQKREKRTFHISLYSKRTFHEVQSCKIQYMLRDSCAQFLQNGGFVERAKQYRLTMLVVRDYNIIGPIGLIIKLTIVMK